MGVACAAGIGRIAAAPVCARPGEETVNIMPSDTLDRKLVSQKIDEYVRPSTFPVAVKFLRKGEAPPEKARRPLADMERHVTVCQGWAIARRYGWTTVLRAEDMKCPLGALVAGF